MLAVTDPVPAGAGPFSFSGLVRHRHGMEETRQRRLPTDDASTDDVPPEAWQHKITPRDFYAEVEADPRARERVQTALSEIAR